MHLKARGQTVLSGSVFKVTSVSKRSIRYLEVKMMSAALTIICNYCIHNNLSQHEQRIQCMMKKKEQRYKGQEIKQEGKTSDCGIWS